MNDEIIAGIALVIAGIVGFLTYKKKVGGMSKKQKFIEKAKRAGHYTVGEYEDSKIQFGNRDSADIYMKSNALKVKYKYRVNGIAYYKQLTFQDPGKVSIDYPASITVYYDPQNPKKAVCHEEATKSKQRESGCLVTIGITILTLFAVFHILRLLIGLIR